KLFRGFADKPEDAVYKECEATGEHEAKITLAQPFAGFISSLSLPAFAMQSPKALEEYKADEVGGTAESPQLSEYARAHPTGTGPYKFESWSVGEDIKLTANEDYWG
ncbi:ABC transporter substrate-binding protein, partial [Xanthomonas citri pv. citri]|nr:ABC transporter substrate-binding protein [Xanthomonas citri pv. citri]